MPERLFCSPLKKILNAALVRYSLLLLDFTGRGEAVPSAPYPGGGAPGYPTSGGGPYQHQTPYPGPLNGAGARDTHIMLFKVPIMLCSNSQHQANYAHRFVPIMLSQLQYFAD